MNENIKSSIFKKLNVDLNTTSYSKLFKEIEVLKEEISQLKQRIDTLEAVINELNILFD